MEPIADQLEDLWDRFDALEAPEFSGLLESLLAQLPEGDPRIAFERGGFQDATDHPVEAVELYRQALSEGLSGAPRRQAVIQLASSLRNLGELVESEALLRAELEHPVDEYTSAIQAFLALVLGSRGRDQEGLSVALTALIPHVTQYQTSLTHYVQEMSSRR
ncbi:tetratricopeptide repeat protein [Psychromicrobium xiongbiense]|uniref:tetratricopeptide repeat protein n=1 Tax=Psychromicrobium xiongbiense TaxID=3051184 RepID=UPI002552802B|nr:tetratricopeptide repeat protein [Psychromicrobium sp. YIM S02556]